jgi:O-antigen/teichoic acid export membrane protein
MTETPQPSLTQRVASAAAWNTLLFPARFVVGLAASVLLFRFLTLAEYGVLTLLTGLAATIGLYADLGIERSLPRFIPEVEVQGGRAGVAGFLRRIIALKLAIIVACIAALLLFSGPLLGYVVANEQRTLQQADQKVAALTAQGAPADEINKAVQERAAEADVIRQIEQRGRLFLWAVGALVFFGALYDVFMQFLTAYFKQRSWNIITVVVTLLQPLLIIGFILLGWRLEGVLLGLVITPVLAVALAAWQAARAGRELGSGDPDATADRALARRFAGFAGMSFFIQVTTWFYDLQFVTFVLYAIGVPLDQMALLAFAYKFAKDYLGYVYIPFSGVLTPLLARIRGRQDHAALQETYGGLTRIFALLLIPAGVGLALLAPRLLALLYPRYVDTTTLIYLFVGFTFAESLLSVPHNILMVYERYQPVFLSRALALVSVPLLATLPLLAPDQRLVVAAIGVGAARVLSRLTTIIYVKQRMDLRFPLGFVGRVLVATFLFGLPLLLLLPVWPLPATAVGVTGKAAAALSLGTLAALSGLGYLIALRLLGGLDEQERKRILSLKLPFKSTLARLL